MKHHLAAFLLLVLALGACTKSHNTGGWTQVDVKLVDKPGMPIAGDSVFESFAFKTVPDPATGFAPYPLYYSERQITNAAGIATFLIADSVFRYQDKVSALYSYEFDSSGKKVWENVSTSVSKGARLTLTLQTR